MNQHEKHQYFYEKYLRNEMPDSERKAFDEKLSEDESFRRSFTYYRNHRKEFLENLLEEDETEAKRRWNLNSWLSLLISVTGIVLAVNYYLSRGQQVQPKAQAPQAGSTWSIFNRLPFLSSQPETKKPGTHTTVKSEPPSRVSDEQDFDSTESQTLMPDEAEPVAAIGEAGIANDIMELDSFIVAYEKSYFELRLKTIRDATDSMIVDSVMQVLTARSASRNIAQSKPVMVYVEFWRSPVNFRGYKFNGKKLMVYGINSPYEIYLLRDGSDFMLLTAHSEFALTNDNNFHKF